MTTPNPSPSGSAARCPTCGGVVRVHTGGEGTSSYEPVEDRYPHLCVYPECLGWDPDRGCPCQTGETT